MSPRAIQEKLHVTILSEPNTFSWYRATVLAAAARIASNRIDQTGVPVMSESRPSAETNDDRTDQCSKPPHKGE
jgi:hypothetical protein